MQDWLKYVTAAALVGGLIFSAGIQHATVLRLERIVDAQQQLMQDMRVRLAEIESVGRYYHGEER